MIQSTKKSGFPFETTTETQLPNLIYITRKTLAAIVAILILTMYSGVPAPAWGEHSGKTKAKIGILVQSGEKYTKARAKQKIKKGAFLRIYAAPRSSSYIYVVHSDGTNATLLHHAKINSSAGPLVIPGDQSFFQVDGKAEKEKITVICSKAELTELKSIFSQSVTSSAHWNTIKKKMSRQGKWDPGETIEKPIALAGNVRSANPIDPEKRFIDNLRTYTGTSILYKTYVFTVGN